MRRQPDSTTEAGAAPHGDVAAERRALAAAALQRMAKGDHAAFELFYRVTSGRIYALLLQMLPTTSAADDALQEVYLKVWNNAGRFDAARASPMSWLLAIARNHAIDRLRADPLLGRAVELDEAILPGVAPEAPERYAAQQQSRRLRDCLQALETPGREAIRAAFFAGLTHEQLARRAGMPLGTMKGWIRRSLHALRECLER